MKIIRALLVVLMLSCLLNSCKESPPEKPNIVFIFLDDLGWTDAGFMGSKYYETPNIDRLAEGGMIFTSAYSNAANCAPTRASLLSGQYSPRHGVYTVANPARGEAKDRRLIPTENSRKISLDKITIAEAIKPSGYTTAAIGKWNVGDSPQKQGFDVGVDRPGFKGGHFNQEGDYLADRLTNQAVDFIAQNKDKPFFLYLAHHAVHTPIQAKAELIKKYEGKTPSGAHKDPTYAAMIESVDEGVGRINQTLENLGLSENTILIFFSDNGGHGVYTDQKPLRGGKGMFYEGGIRVPMFVYWPEKISGNSKSDEPIISTDFYTTFLELTGAEQPENYQLDGESILPILNGESIEREAIYWHFPAYLQAYNGLQDDSRDRAFRSRPVSVIRKEDWKLMLFHEEWVLDGGREKIASNNAVELYNLENDISESNNLVNSEIDKRDELLDDLLNWIKKTNAPIPAAANPEYISNMNR